MTASADLATKLRRHRIVFVHDAPLFGDLLAQLLLPLHVYQLSAEAFCNLDAAGLASITAQSRILVISDIASLAHPGTTHTLGQLRANIYAATSSGSDFCLVSSRPKTHFPRIPGSSILDDSKTFFLPLAPTVDGDRFGDTVFPAVRSADDTDMRSLLTETLSGVDVRGLAELDRALFELGVPGDALGGEIDPSMVDELRGLGLLTENAEGQVVLSCPRRLVELRLALGDAISGLVSAPHGYFEIASGMFAIERIIRRALREVATSLHRETWRRKVLYGDLPTKVLERARQDAYPLVQTVSELRDPLEWLTLGELLEMIGRSDFNNLGKDAGFWARFGHDVLPVRNRISHMRLPQDKDGRVVRTWESILARAF